MNGALIRVSISAAVSAGLILAWPGGILAAQPGPVQMAQNTALEATLSNAIGASQIFTLLFVTLGPFKVLAPFAKETRGADPALRRRIAFLAFAISTVSLFAAMFIGQNTLSKWQVSLPALVITAGALLFAVAFRTLIHLYDPNEAHAPAEGKPTLRTAITPLTFPAIATPYGIAILILLKAALPDQEQQIIVALAIVMVLDLLAMLFAREILRYAGAALQLIGTILTVLQAALGIQLLILGIRTVMGAHP